MLINVIVLHMINAQQLNQNHFDDSTITIYRKANNLYKKGEYNQSLSLFEKLLKKKIINSNISYKIGVCVYNLSNDHAKSLNFFRKAEENINKEVNFYDLDEQAAPFETYYYLAKLYHLIYETETSVLFALEYLKYYNRSIKTEAISFSDAEFFKTDIDNLLSKNYFLDKSILNPIDIELSKIETKLKRDNTYMSNLRIGKIYRDDILLYNFDSLRNSEIRFLKLSKFESGRIKVKELNNIVSNKNYKLIGSNANNTLILIQSGTNYYLSKIELPYLVLKKEINFGAGFGDIISATISNDTTKLIFEAFNPKSLGSTDLFLSTKSKKELAFNSFTNLGYAVNSQNTESNPSFIGSTNYFTFSSDGHNSIGGFDIFAAKIDKNNNSIVTNLGFPLNSTSDDYDFNLLSNGAAVILSNRNIFNNQIFYTRIKNNNKGNTLSFILEKIRQIKKQNKQAIASNILDSKANDKTVENDNLSINGKNSADSTNLIFAGQAFEIEKEIEKEVISIEELTKEIEVEIEKINLQVVEKEIEVVKLKEIKEKEEVEVIKIKEVEKNKKPLEIKIGFININDTNKVSRIEAIHKIEVVKEKPIYREKIKEVPFTRPENIKNFDQYQIKVDQNTPFLYINTAANELSSSFIKSDKQYLKFLKELGNKLNTTDTISLFIESGTSSLIGEKVDSIVINNRLKLIQESVQLDLLKLTNNQSKYIKIIENKVNTPVIPSTNAKIELQINRYVKILAY